MAKKGRFIDPSNEPSNIIALWTRLHSLDATVATAVTTIAQQATTISSLQSVQAFHTQQIQQALITAGKATSASAQSNAGGGTGSGGSTDSHPNHQQAVIDAKAELVALGEDLTGPCGAFKITRKVAQMLTPSEPDAGLLAKPTGNNCLGYAVDIICYNDGVIYDILGDAGGSNDPQWNFGGSVDPSRWRASF